MGKCSGRCTLVAFCCLQLVSSARPGGRGRVGRRGAGSRGSADRELCLGVCLVREPGSVVVRSHGADGRSLLLLAGLSLCVRFSPGAPWSRSVPCARVPGPPRAWGSTRLPPHYAGGLLSGVRCGTVASWDWGCV